MSRLQMAERRGHPIWNRRLRRWWRHIDLACYLCASGRAQVKKQGTGATTHPRDPVRRLCRQPPHANTPPSPPCTLGTDQGGVEFLWPDSYRRQTRLVAEENISRRKTEASSDALFAESCRELIP